MSSFCGLILFSGDWQRERLIERRILVREDNSRGYAKVPDSADKVPDTMKTMPNKEVINRYCKKVGLTISGKMVYNRWQKKKILRGGV